MSRFVYPNYSFDLIEACDSYTCNVPTSFRMFLWLYRVVNCYQYFIDIKKALIREHTRKFFCDCHRRG